MKRFNIFIAVIAVSLGFIFSGCENGDPETEQKLAGTWVSQMTDYDYSDEDDIPCTLTTEETYSLPDHVYTAKAEMFYGHPINMKAFTVEYRGKWKASKEEIEVKIDKNSVEIKFYNNFFDSSDKKDIKQDILSGLKEDNYKDRMKFTSPISDTFTAVDIEGEETTYTRLQSSTEGLPENANVIEGDFDGDGKTDLVWIKGEFDDQGYAEAPLELQSDNSKLHGLSWNAPRGVMLKNLGSLDGSNRDYLGAIPYADSDWAQYKVYRFNNNGWKEAIDSFTIWIGNDDYDRVRKSDREGYIVISENDMSDPENGFDNKHREVKLK